MHIWAFLLGFLICAAFGSLVTDSTLDQLKPTKPLSVPPRSFLGHLEVFFGGIWTRLRAVRKDFPSPAGLPKRIVLAIFNLTRLQYIGILLLIWIASLWFIDRYGPEGAVSEFVWGSAVGVAAAPWVWLHFVRSFNTSDSGEFERYKFLTIVLGIAGLVAVLSPRIPEWLGRTQKVEGWGFALSLTDSRPDRGTPISSPSSAGLQGSESGFDRLVLATEFAHRVANPKLEPSTASVSLEPQKKNPPSTPTKLSEVDSTLTGFDNLSLIDRDRAYIAFFVQQRAAEQKLSTPQTYQNLDVYVKDAEDRIKTGLYGYSKEHFNDDDEFLKAISPLSNCIMIYASKLRDLHLFFVDTGPFFRFFIVGLKEALNPDEMASDAEMLATQIAKPLKKLLSSTDLTNGAQPCEGVQKPIASLRNNLKVGWWTPYPAYMIAHYFAAIDSVDSGIAILQDWMKDHDFDWGTSPLQDWYRIRALLTISQLPYRFATVTPTHNSLIILNKFVTDRMRDLIGFNRYRFWADLCKNFTNDDLHSRLFRTLAFTYADERNYYFESLQPQDFNLSKRAHGIINETPSSYIAEIDEILNNASCFAGVPKFDVNRERLLGQYNLNAAQLLAGTELGAAENEKAAKDDKIRARLQAAGSLRKAPDVSTYGSGSRRLPDLLAPSDEFDRQRTRLLLLEQGLDSR